MATRKKAARKKPTRKVKIYAECESVMKLNIMLADILHSLLASALTNANIKK